MIYHLQKYGFRDKNGHPLENCKEYLDMLKQISDLRELLAAVYIELSGKEIHTSDCATSNAPAEMPGRCNCNSD